MRRKKQKDNKKCFTKNQLEFCVYFLRDNSAIDSTQNSHTSKFHIRILGDSKTRDRDGENRMETILKKTSRWQKIVRSGGGKVVEEEEVRCVRSGGGKVVWYIAILLCF